jgi:predicted SnoaL-like aldol condensation-catalyzing enzyme
MTTRDDASALVKRLHECFNTRQFDQADDLHTPDCFSHPLGTTGFEAGKDAWRWLTAHFPGMRVVAEDILVDGDKVTVRSSVQGTETPDGGPQPFLIEIFRIEDGRFAENWGSTWLPRLG